MDDETSEVKSTKFSVFDGNSEDSNPSDESTISDDFIEDFGKCLNFPWFRHQFHIKVRRTTEAVLKKWEKKRFFHSFNRLVKYRLKQ